ncbi:MAG: hypothetical protein ACRCXM_06800 [Beijerinckiaceae bacterium]
MTARVDHWNKEFDAAFHRLRWNLRLDELVQRAEALAGILRKYTPGQPRIPAGQADGGQWTSGGGGLVRVAGGFEPQHMEMTVQSFKSKYCLGEIRGKLPNDFNDMTIAEVIELRNAGNKKAILCIKLLGQDRFRK